jgi:DNA (cytosine-5)-methyltransferase 1
VSAPTIGSLFSGYLGLDHALTDAIGPTRLAWVCDIDKAASRLLAHHHPDVPNLGDVTAVDWATVEPVDVLTGGFPCQDVSHAGRRAGLAPGTRTGLWARMADAIDHLRPSLVVAENVRGLLSARADSDVEPCPWCMGGAGDGEPALRALGAVLGDLAELGYDAAWHGLRAADIGAPHGRFRVFIVAWPAANADDERHAISDWPSGRRWPGPAERGRADWDSDSARARTVSEVRAGVRSDTESGGTGRPTAADANRAARNQRRFAAPGQAEGWWPRPDTGGRGRASSTDATGDGWDKGRPESARIIWGSDAPLGGADTAADPYGDAVWLEPVPEPRRGDPAEPGRAGVEWGPYAAAIARWERVLGRPAPAPTEPSRAGGQRLNPRLVEWMMGCDDGWVCDVPGLTRNDKLRLLGNGVVRQQGAAAIRHTLTVMRAAA